MAKLKMKRIEIIALLEDSKKIIDLLQRRGVVELLDYEKNDALHKLSTSTTLSMFEKFQSVAQTAQTILNNYVPVKQSLLNALNGRKELTSSEISDKTENPDAVLRKCYELVDLSKKIAESNNDIVRIRATMDSLVPWLDLDISMSRSSTAQTEIFIGTLPAEYTVESLLGVFARSIPEVKELDAEVVSSSKDQSCITVICHKEYAAKTEQALRDNGFVRSSEIETVLPKVRYESYEKEILRLNEDIEKAADSIKAHAAFREDIEFIIDYFTVRLDKYENLKKLSLSQNVFALSGYIPACNAENLVEELERDFEIAINIDEPGEDDMVPIMLKNNAFSAPVESVTEMYSLPGNDDVDPNPVMAFFYYCFFGMMLSDAGYGLLMIIAMLIVKKKVNLEEKTKKTVNLFLYCGISTMFWGAMFGSWFGDIVQIVGKQFFNKDVPSLALWFEPVRDPMKLLLYAFLFGIIHLFVGLGVRFSMLWKAGKKLDALFDVIPVYLLVLGAAPLGAGIVIAVPAIFAVAGKYLALAGAVLIVLTAGRSTKNIAGKLGGGLYGLYNIGAGYMGDILSYSRLLALGLSTGVVASVVNVLGTISSNLIVKGIMLVFVFIFGHSVNIAVNLIGSYVHTNRLQFVEFFSKFYEGGGRAFTPLKANTKYYRFKEETKNG